jgi:hypothetical protein
VKLLPRHFEITQNAGQEPWALRFASVNRNYGCSTITVTNEMMTPFNSGYNEAFTTERGNKIFAANRRV